MNWGSILGGLVQPVADLFVKRTERKMAKDSLKSKAEMAKQSGSDQITLTDSEWEAVKASKEGESWKDEYITVLVSSPYALVIIGVFWLTFTGDPTVMNSAIMGLEAMQSVGIDMDYLMTIVVMAAVSLKVWRQS